MKIGSRIKKLLKWGLVLLLLAIVYRYNPYQIEFLGHYDKIWAHRVNTLDKLAWTKPFFNGVEIDIVYQDGIFDITHPPKPSIGLTLEAYLQHLDPKDSTGLWLDLKNLAPNNAQEIHDRIEELLEATTYPKALLLIESRSPDALQVFLNDGYRASYYLPDGMHYMKSSRLDSTIIQVQAVIKKYPTLEISSHFRDYPIMNKNFNASKNLWAIQHSRFTDYSAIRALLADETVKTVLIRYKSVQGYR